MRGRRRWLGRAGLLALLLIARPAWAADARAALEQHLDVLLALEHGGGWTYWSPPGTRPWPHTGGLGWAERIGRRVGLARWDVIVLRSPGTPAGGLALLGGYQVTGRPEYLAAARRAGDLLLATQLGSGGWFSEMPVRRGRLAWWFRWVIPGPSIDDDVTPGAVRLLLALFEATGEERYRTGAERGIALLQRAQLPSGAWPLVLRPAWLRWLRPSFEDLATTNDGATPAAIETLIAGGRVLGRADLLAAARRGGDWLATAHGAPPQAGWAQQYAADGAPASGRAFEWPALASWETRYAVDALERLAAATGDGRFCAAAEEAVAWLARSALAPGCWARFYTYGANAPLYVTAAGTAVKDPALARPGYSWIGAYGIPATLARFGRDGANGGAAVLPLLGDPGTCPGRRPTGVDADIPGDARAHIARAGELLAVLERPAPACASGVARLRSPRERRRGEAREGSPAQGLSADRLR